MNRGPVVLTGATGFIGGALLKLLLQNGREVRALTRSPEKLTSRIDRFWISGLDDVEGIEKGLRGASAVVHLAGRVLRETARWSSLRTRIPEGLRHSWNVWKDKE